MKETDKGMDMRSVLLRITNDCNEQQQFMYEGEYWEKEEGKT